VLDIDRLAAVNDASGRPMGDSVLRGIADILRKSVREVDVVARFGGDEFLIILPSTHFAGSVTVAERIWREIGEHAFLGDLTRRSKVTASVGVALYPSRDVRTKDALLRSADTALMQAKRDGGNRVCVFQQQGYLYTPVMGQTAAADDAAPLSGHAERSSGRSSERPPAAPGSTRPTAAPNDRPPPRRGDE
jgi:diguanylate cyclase (GGDEF)-like protein